jgi:hypothetical protein
MPSLVFVALAIAILGAAYGIQTAYERRRRAALQQYCDERGYRFEPKRPDAEEALADEFPIFNTGYSRRWSYTITGAYGGQPFTACEYSYVTGGGKSSHRHVLGMMLWETPGANLPRFMLGPENFFDRLAQRFGKQDFDFEGDEEFSRGYQLQGDDETAVKALFTASRRAYLSAAGPDGRIERHHLAGAGNRLLWWRTGRLPVPDEMDQFIADGDRVRRLFMEERGN